MEAAAIEQSDFSAEFSEWLNTFIDEKGLDREQTFEVEGGLYGTNFIPLGCVIEAIEQAPEREQRAIRQKIVQLDFANADVMEFFEHLAKALAV